MERIGAERSGRIGAKNTPHTHTEPHLMVLSPREIRWVRWIRHKRKNRSRKPNILCRFVAALVGVFAKISCTEPPPPPPPPVLPLPPTPPRQRSRFSVQGLTRTLRLQEVPHAKEGATIVRKISIPEGLFQVGHQQICRLTAALTQTTHRKKHGIQGRSKSTSLKMRMEHGRSRCTHVIKQEGLRLWLSWMGSH